MKSSAKKTFDHTDIFGRKLEIGDVVAAPYWNKNLGIFSVTRMTPKLVHLRKVGAKSTKSSYPVDVVKVDGPEVTMYILKNSTG